MAKDVSHTKLDRAAVATDRLELTALVGQVVKLYSRQFAGRALGGKVISAGDQRILVAPGGPLDPLTSLVNHQKVVVQFPYKGQEISVNAWLKRSDGGRCYFEFDTKVVPLSQRRFLRVPQECMVRLAAVSLKTSYRQKLGNLRWIESNTDNFSSGGVLLNVPGYLENGVTLLLNIDAREELLPPLVMGRVRYCYQDDDSGYKAGVEFLVKEVTTRLLPPPMLAKLPPVVLNYTVATREKLNRKLQVLRRGIRESHRSQV